MKTEELAEALSELDINPGGVEGLARQIRRYRICGCDCDDCDGTREGVLLKDEIKNTISSWRGEVVRLGEKVLWVEDATYSPKKGHVDVKIDFEGWASPNSGLCLVEGHLNFLYTRDGFKRYQSDEAGLEHEILDNDEAVEWEENLSFRQCPECGAVIGRSVSTGVKTMVPGEDGQLESMDICSECEEWSVWGDWEYVIGPKRIETNFAALEDARSLLEQNGQDELL